jgi:hypothetical protein
MTESKDFPQKILEIILPSIKEMIEKEQEHISYLEKELEKAHAWNSRFWTLTKMPIDQLEEFLLICNTRLARLKQLQTEYEEYALKNW